MVDGNVNITFLGKPHPLPPEKGNANLALLQETLGEGPSSLRLVHIFLQVTSGVEAQLLY